MDGWMDGWKKGCKNKINLSLILYLRDLGGRASTIFKSNPPHQNSLPQS